MRSLGVFCGKYMTDCRKEFPASWFKKAKLSPKGRDCSLNYFGVAASRPLSEWRANGWLHNDDPRGWFQWYCRYFMGRRISGEDRRQIKRWKAFRRHINQIKMNCEPGDPFCRPRGNGKLCCTGLTIAGRYESGWLHKQRRQNRDRLPSVKMTVGAPGSRQAKLHTSNRSRTRQRWLQRK